MGVFGFGPHSQHEFFLLIAALVLGCDWEHDVSCVEPCVTVLMMRQLDWTPHCSWGLESSSEAATKSKGKFLVVNAL